MDKEHDDLEQPEDGETKLKAVSLKKRRKKAYVGKADLYVVVSPVLMGGELIPIGSLLHMGDVPRANTLVDVGCLLPVVDKPIAEIASLEKYVTLLDVAGYRGCGEIFLEEPAVLKANLNVPDTVIQRILKTIEKELGK